MSESPDNSGGLPFSPSFLLGGLVILVLWQILLPGYVFGLDGVVGPTSGNFVDGFGFLNRLPWRLFNQALFLFLPGWVVQKVIIIGLFAALACLPYRYLPLPSRFARLWAAVFFVVNPFVYTRFLAGQLGVLFGYAFLPPFFFHLFRFFWGGGQRRDAGLMFIWLLVISFLSLHFFAIAALVLFGATGVWFASALAHRGARRHLGSRTAVLAVAAALFIVVSSYWLAPVLFRSAGGGQPLSISAESVVAFRTAADSHLGTTLNVLALHGFWAEDDPWAGYFFWPKDNFWLWLPVWLVLLVIAGYGIRSAWQDRERRPFAAVVLISAFSAFIFSCGVGESVFRPINDWLFARVGFWRGFRDTTKWSAVLAVAYAYFGALGAASFVAWASRRGTKWRDWSFLAVLVLPLLFTYPMLGGFARQVRPVWYPTSWYEAKSALEREDEGATLALPWHQYLSLPFNRNRISANPTRLFFGERIVQSEDMELAGVSGERPGSLSDQAGQILRDVGSASGKMMRLRDLGITHIVALKELMGRDDYDYGWLSAATILYDSAELTVYRLP